MSMRTSCEQLRIVQIITAINVNNYPRFNNGGNIYFLKLLNYIISWNLQNPKIGN